MNKKIIKRIYNVVVVLFLVGAVAWCFSYFVHGVDVEYTDDAQVCRHITPINTRVPGFIKEIRFTDFQHVHKGDTLVIIEDAEFRLQVAQAEAGLRGSKSGSSVVTASMGTTVSNVQTASAGIEARHAMNRPTAVARVLPRYVMCRPISWVARVQVRVWLKPSSILPVSIFPILSLWLPVMV